MNMPKPETVIRGLMLLFIVGVCIFSVVLWSILFPDNRPRHPDHDWYGECDKGAYWYDEQYESNVCITASGEVSTCRSKAKVFQQDMSEKDYAVYCKGQ